jgi:hypothetical protein
LLLFASLGVPQASIANYPYRASSLASGALGGLGTIAAAVVGNVVSQGVGLATGIQQKFHFAGWH